MVSAYFLAYTYFAFSKHVSLNTGCYVPVVAFLAGVFFVAFVFSTRAVCLDESSGGGPATNGGAQQGALLKWSFER